MFCGYRTGGQGTADGCVCVCVCVGGGLLLCFVGTALVDTADTDMLFTGFLIPSHRYTTTAFVIANIM